MFSTRRLTIANIFFKSIILNLIRHNKSYILIRKTKWVTFLLEQNQKSNAKTDCPKIFFFQLNLNTYFWSASFISTTFSCQTLYQTILRLETKTFDLLLYCLTIFLCGFVFSALVITLHKPATILRDIIPSSSPRS